MVGKGRDLANKPKRIAGRYLTINEPLIKFIVVDTTLSTYILFTGKNLKDHKVLKDNQKQFDDNLKDKIFKKDVEVFKTAT